MICRQETSLQSAPRVSDSTSAANHVVSCDRNQPLTAELAGVGCIMTSAIPQLPAPLDAALTPATGTMSDAVSGSLLRHGKILIWALDFSHARTCPYTCQDSNLQWDRHQCSQSIRNGAGDLRVPRTLVFSSISSARLPNYRTLFTLPPQH